MRDPQWMIRGDRYRFSGAWSTRKELFSRGVGLPFWQRAFEVGLLSFGEMLWAVPTLGPETAIDPQSQSQSAIKISAKCNGGRFFIWAESSSFSITMRLSYTIIYVQLVAYFNNFIIQVFFFFSRLLSLWKFSIKRNDSFSFFCINFDKFW